MSDLQGLHAAGSHIKHTGAASARPSATFEFEIKFRARRSLELHEAVGDALAGKAAHEAGQAVLQELDAQARGAVQHSVPWRTGRARRKHCARNARQHLVHACEDLMR